MMRDKTHNYVFILFVQILNQNVYSDLCVFTNFILLYSCAYEGTSCLLFWQGVKFKFENWRYSAVQLDTVATIMFYLDSINTISHLPIPTKWICFLGELINLEWVYRITEMNYLSWKHAQGPLDDSSSKWVNKTSINFPECSHILQTGWRSPV